MESPTRVRPERREVGESRERILAAAESYFADHGIDASLHGLAEAAGVGIATLFRRFPTREELVRALYDREVLRVDAMLDEVGSRHAEGWPRIAASAAAAIDIVLALPILPALQQRMARINPEHRPGDRWIAPLLRDVEVAKAAGELRADATGYEIAALLTSIGGFLHLGEPIRRTIAARHVQVVLDGLRAPARSVLPPFGVDVATFHRAAHGISAGPAGPADEA